jgi:flagellar biosynthesis/type III secretory pathway chaperone
MESSPAVFESLSHPGVLPNQDSPFHSECLTTALELLEILREEAEILRRFAGAELLALIPKKEYLVNELEWKLESAKQAGECSLTAPDSFKALLGEIVKLNTANGVFIEKTLSYWQDFLAIFSPPSYGPAGKKTRRPARPPKGLTFRREI